jgi:hypothetical protein
MQLVTLQHYQKFVLRIQSSIDFHKVETSSMEGGELLEPTKVLFRLVSIKLSIKHVEKKNLTTQTSKFSHYSLLMHILFQQIDQT